MAKLQNYSWPGNVRELEHFLERMVALSTKDELDEQDVPELVQLSDVETPVSVSLKGVNTVKLENVLYETEKRLILWAMDRSKGNLSHAADMLDIPRSTLQYKLNKFNKQETSSTLDH